MRFIWLRFYDSVFYDSVFYDSVFYNSVFYNRLFYDCIFYDSVFCVNKSQPQFFNFLAKKHKLNHENRDNYSDLGKKFTSNFLNVKLLLPFRFLKALDINYLDQLSDVLHNIFCILITFNNPFKAGFLN